MKRQYRIDQKTINIIIFIIVSTLIFLVFDSMNRLQNNLKYEQEMEQKKTKFQKAGKVLLDASNYLSEEARKFVVTGETKYLNNYLEELYSRNARNKAFEAFDRLELNQQEKRLLNVARENFNMSILQEIRAMKLMAESLGMNENDLPEEIRSYILNVEEKEMSRKEKRQQSIQRLFEYDYVTERDVINEYVEQSQEQVYYDIEQEAQRAAKQTQNALDTQMVLLMVVVAVFVGVLLGSYQYIIAPIVEYRKRVSESDEEHPLQVTAQGTREAYDLGEALNRMHQTMRDAMAAENRFIAAMSHEIKTPLNSLIGYEYLLRDTGLTGQQKKYADLIRRAAKNLQQLVENILDYSKLEQEKVELHETDVCIREFLEELRDIYAYMAQSKGLYLKIWIDEDVPELVRCDEDKLRHILTNLISNGLKFTEEGGIKIFIHKEDNEGETMLLLQVEDSGIGILEEDKEKIFGYFDQSYGTMKKNFGGSGLGLHISRKMTEFMGGNISVDSIYGMGSVFNVRIPVTEAEGTVTTGESQKIRFSHTSILLVEDNRVNQMMEEKILSKFGIQTTTADNGYQAMVAAQQKVYDLIFMDLRMEGMDGFTASRKIREYGKNQETTIIALTADTKEGSWEKIKEAGMDEWLAKPFKVQELVQMLMKFLPGKFEIQEYEKEIERKNALDMLEGDESLYDMLLERFFRDHENDFQMLPKLWKEGKMEKLANSLHMLKGVCGGIGAQNLQEACRKMEKKIEKHVADHKDAEEILKLYQKAKLEMEKKQSWSHCETRVEPSDKLDSRETFLQWRKMVEEQNFDALDFWKSHRKIFAQIFTECQQKEITKSLEQFEFSKCYDFLTNEGGWDNETSNTIC